MIEPASSPPQAASTSWLIARVTTWRSPCATPVRAQARAAYLDSGNRFGITARDAIPLGHKIALRDLGESENVLEYGVLIGLTRGPVAAGELVHTHNLRSARWQKSV